MKENLFIIFSILILSKVITSARIPTKCETCKLFSIEINKVLKKIENEGFLEKNFDYEAIEKSSKKYSEKELILFEATHMACRNLLNYHIHPNRKGAARYADDIHSSFKYKAYREGEKMRMEPDDEKWEVAPLEMMNLKKECDNLVDLYFEDIEDWFNEHRSKSPILKYLCENIVLKKIEDKSCLNKLKDVYQRKEL